jgi:metallo-beta-lactamase family protein
MSVPLTLRFDGAARTVTGSRHRIRFGDRAWLFDCGLYQGHREEADRVNRTFRFTPGELNAVVLSHAHLDHTGNLPTLVAAGYGGSIHATAATTDLARFMLADSAHLMQKDVEHVNRHHPGAARDPLYTPADAERALERFVSHAYHEPWDLFPGVRVEYRDAGHILGSALTVFTLVDGDRTLRLGMSGDLGRPNRRILRDPETLPGVDVLVLESTYGDRLHPDNAETERQLVEVVKRAAARGGRLLVPAFAVGRTQELVATLHDLTQRGAIPDLPIYVDSPMARLATGTYRQHPECFDEETAKAFAQGNGEPFGFARLRYIATPDESRAVSESSTPAIVIAASGMCEGGRILHHLRHGLGDPKNTVLFVGFQAEGTLGRRLREGAEVVNLLGDPVTRRAEIAGLDGFSAHADQREILTWLGAIQPRPRRVYLVHGEPGPADVLAQKIRDTFSIEARVPAPGEEHDLWN